MEGVTASKVIAENLNAMHAARKAFVENEASDKLRRALQSKTRTATQLTYEVGDKVFYKRKSSDKWLGPARVLGSENKQVFVKHRGEYYRVSPVHLQLANQLEISVDSQQESSSSERSISTTSKSTDQSIYGSASSDDESVEGEHRPETENDITLENLLDGVNVPLEEETETQEDCGGVETSERNPTIRDGTMPLKGSKISYKRPECDTWESATVIGRSGTARGKNKWWSNIRGDNETLSSLNMEELDAWKYVDEEVLLTNADTSDVMMAKMKELHNLKQHKV